MTQQPRTPTTKTGEWLLTVIEDVTGANFDMVLGSTPDIAILAIEAEARADLLAQIEKAVLAITGSSLQPGYMLGAEDMRKAVLAAIRSAAPVEPTAPESKTVFRFADGTTGPGKWDPTNGGRIVPDLLAAPQPEPPAELRAAIEAELELIEPDDAKRDAFDSGAAAAYSYVLSRLTAEEEA